MWAGFGLSSGSWLSTLVVTAWMLYTYGVRIRHEETLLLEHLGRSYLEYIEQTPAVIPRPWRRRAL
jgi:protein-S-isoprenylcysteine O-methyltransferase Ste14